jgi:hypothetical protein
MDADGKTIIERIYEKMLDPSLGQFKDNLNQWLAQISAKAYRPTKSARSVVIP